MTANTRDPCRHLRLFAICASGLFSLACTYQLSTTMEVIESSNLATTTSRDSTMLGQRSTSTAEMMTSETSSPYSMEIRNENTTRYGDANENIVTAAEGESTVPFTMCGRTAPFKHDIHQFHVDWPRDNKILLLRNDGKFGHMGNQINSLLHSFDYARDHRLDLGMLFHSWAMDAIHTMFYETSDFEALGRELRRDLGILVVRNQTMLAGYDEVISKNSQKLYFYQSANVGVNHWTETMYVHAAFLQRLFLRYNQGYGYVHNGLRAADVCTTLNMFFRERASEAKYTVIHSRYLDGNAEWRLEKMAKTTKITVEGGALYMSPGYVKAILRPLGMLEHPIILLSDGQLPSVERGLLNDPIIGPNLMVLSHKDSLDGADVALAVLADVFIGNPASITSGFVARSRYALGYPEKSTQLFRRKRIHRWYSVCNEECVFNPWMLGQWV